MVKVIKDLLSKYKSWKLPTKIAIWLAIVAIIITILFYFIPFSKIIDWITPSANIEVHLVKSNLEQFPINSTWTKENNSLYVWQTLLINACNWRVLTTRFFYEKLKEEYKEYVGINILGKGCDNCYYYFLYINNIGKSYNKEIEIKIDTSTMDVEFLPEKDPETEVKVGGFPGERKINIFLNKNIKEKEKIPLIAFRTKNLVNISISLCRLKSKGKCDISNEEEKIWVIPPSVNKIKFLGIGEVNLPEAKKEIQLFLYNISSNKFEENGEIKYEGKC